jgi:hypothetical protein
MPTRPPATHACHPVDARGGSTDAAVDMRASGGYPIQHANRGPWQGPWTYTLRTLDVAWRVACLLRRTARL